MQIVVSNISVEVIRKNIKNMHLAVLPPDGRVRVSAPTQLTDEAITMFVRTKLGWIKKQQEKFQQQPRQSERQYVSGETLYVWGKQYFLQMEYSYKGNALTLSGDKAIAHRSDGTVGCTVVIQLIRQPVFSRTFQVFLQAAGEDEPSVLHWLIVNQPIQL